MAAHIYRTSDGNRIPSVTTILGRFKESGALIHWAWDLGMQGKDYREVRDSAASSGTAAHKLVEDHIRHRQVDMRDVSDEAKQAYQSFLRWAENSRLQATETEVSLVSEQYRFGGTLDAMLINDQLSLGDWKTSASVYPEYLLQLAAYGILWEENRSQAITGGYHLIKFGKIDLSFAHYYWHDLDDAKEAFILMCKLYNLMNSIKGRVR